MSLSILILTKNEEGNLPRCLESISWCDDVVVVDSFSIDKTVEIATGWGARVLQRRFDNFANQRNFGLDHGRLKHEWVLHLDADEVVSLEMREELFKAISGAAYNAFRVPSKLIFQNRWLKFSGMYPAYQVRLGRRDHLRFHMVGHGQRETLPPHEIGVLKHPMLHYSFNKGLDDWFARHNNYSRLEAEKNLHQLSDEKANWKGFFSGSMMERRRALKEFSIRLPFRPTFRFLYMYFLHLGFMDGLPGYHYCRMVAMYEYLIVLKLNELRQQRHYQHQL
jgi:glycosyltransferase involved in cell wall biosynthesis